MRVTLDLEDQEARELAQFVKRASWDHFRACAIDDEEAYQIRDAVTKLERALAEVMLRARVSADYPFKQHTILFPYIIDGMGFVNFMVFYQTLTDGREFVAGP